MTLTEFIALTPEQRDTWLDSNEHAHDCAARGEGLECCLEKIAVGGTPEFAYVDRSTTETVVDGSQWVPDERGHINALRDQMQKAQEQRDEAYARIHALEADSARWQWTREQAQGVYDGRTVDWTSESTPEDLDAQVDAARALLEPKLSEPDGGKFINAEEAAVAREAAARALLEPK